MKEKKVTRGEMVITEGERPDGMYIVRSGKVEVFKKINGKEVRLSVIGSNDFFGEMSLFLDQPRTAFVRTLEDCTLLFLSKDEIYDYLQKNTEFVKTLMIRLSKRILEAHKIIGRLEGEKKAFEIMHGH